MKKLVMGLSVICLALASCISSPTSVPPSDSSIPMSSTPTTTPISMPVGNYLLSVTAGPGGTVPTELSGVYPAHTTVEIIAYPDPGFRFYRWVVNSGDPENSHAIIRNPAQFAIYLCDVDVVATFKEASVLFHLDIIIDRSGLAAEGEPVYSGNFLEGEDVGREYILRPPLGWPFERWIVYSSNYEVMGTISRGVYTFAMPPYDVILVAEYREETST